MTTPYHCFDQILEGCQILDPDWRYLYANDAVARQGRQSKDELIGRSMSDLYPGIELTAMFATLKRCMEERRSESFFNEFTFPDGSIGFFELRAQPVEEGLFVLSIDVTSRVEAQRNAERQLVRLRSLREIDLAILGSTDVRLSLSVVVREALRQPHVDAACVLLVEDGEAELRPAAGAGFTPGALERCRGARSGAIGRAMEVRRPVVATAGVPGEVPPCFLDDGVVGLCAAPLVARGALSGVLVAAVRHQQMPDEDCLGFVEALAGQAAMAVDLCRSFEGLKRSHVELALAYDTTIEGWASALDMRDHETNNHTKRVSEWTVRLATRAGIRPEELAHVKRGALLHDIGKMGLPDAILLKAGPLTEDEWTEMRRHPVYAHELIWPIAYLRPALEIPYCHHEKWDGTGYPRGLRGEAIPLAARLFAVVDVWDALCSDRPYRSAWPQEKARAHLQQLSGTHFDPGAVSLFLSVLDERGYEG
ncbi:MAG: HD domain-containing phosphohydrolase [Vicinamibacterales bacterium]